MTEKFYRADRTVLRNVLLTGLEDNISFVKRFLRYEFTDEDVVAHFWMVRLHMAA